MSTTASYVDHYGDQSEVRVLWGSINGVPFYAPFGTRVVRVSLEWLKANPPPDKSTSETMTAPTVPQPSTDA